MQVLRHPDVPNGRCAVWQAFIQVCLHSQGHRAQCAKLLRQHGSVPPATDFIEWVGSRPGPEWGAAADDPRSTPVPGRSES
jgi:hypothetical protein